MDVFLGSRAAGGSVAGVRTRAWPLVLVLAAGAGMHTVPAQSPIQGSVTAPVPAAGVATGGRANAPAAAVLAPATPAATPASATPATATRARPTARLATASPAGRGDHSRLVVDIDPDLPGRADWSFTLQRRSGSRWVPAGRHRTGGAREVRAVAVPAGTYRIRIDARRGFRAAASRPHVVAPTPMQVGVMPGPGQPVGAAGARPDAADRSAPPVGQDRAAVVASWAAYQDQAAVPANWSGDRRTCTPGGTDPAHQQATMDRVNWFRRMVGLGEVSLDPALSSRAQQTALMMAAAGRLSHHPDVSFPCYTEDGQVLAARSNLYLGVGWDVGSGPAAVAAYMDDPGADNTTVGHRRWILHPGATAMATGDVVEPAQADPRADRVASNALLVTGPFATPRAVPGFIAWPNAGFVPRGVVPTSGRWSFSVPSRGLADPARSADFSSAAVSLTGPSGPVAVTVVSSADTGVGEPTLVWQVPELGLAPGMPDTTYTVRISGAHVGGELREFTYQVTVIDLA